VKSFMAALRSLVLPFGRTSGMRIIIDGDAGVIQLYDTANNLVAELGPNTDGGGGLWTRGLQNPQNLSAFLGGGELRFTTVAQNVIGADAEVLYDTDGSTYADLLLSSGGVNVADKRARILLESLPGGTNGTVYVTGDGTNKANLDVDGVFTAGNVRIGLVNTPAPGAAPAQTTATVTFAVPMTATPRVVCTPFTSAANLNVSNIRWAVNNLSANGFDVNCWRDSNFATSFEYIAIST